MDGFLWVGMLMSILEHNYVIIDVEGECGDPPFLRALSSFSRGTCRGSVSASVFLVALECA